MIDDKCCVCGRQLFDEKGKRLTTLCYQIGLMRKTIRKDGQYSDGSECAAYICKSCFSKVNSDTISCFNDMLLYDW